jgi:hypothetical protein
VVPVLSGIYDRIKGNPLTPTTSEWFKYIASPKNHVVELKAEAPTDELSKFEVRLLRDTYGKYGAMDRWNVRDLSHALPEWKDPGSSSRLIAPEQILRLEKVSEEHINRIRTDAAELLFFQTPAR